MKRNTNSMKTKYRIINEQTRSISLETLTQPPSHSKHSNNVHVPLTIDSPDIKRDIKTLQAKNDFINKQSKPFDELRGNRVTIMDPPTKEDVEMFWKPLHENKKEYNKDSAWLQECKTSVNNITEARCSEITTN